MITCPWCGTNYLVFQSNCSNCGGPIPSPKEGIPPTSELAAPPPAPRTFSNRYVWRLLLSDGWGVAALILGLIGLIFSVVGVSLTLAVVTAFVGIPFLALGIILLGLGVSLLVWRHAHAQKIVNVLRMGLPARGQIEEARENYSVEVNGRHPWVIRYRFQAVGRDYEGNVSTLNPVGPDLQAGSATWVLYLPDDPTLNSIYPHP